MSTLFEINLEYRSTLAKASRLEELANQIYKIADGQLGEAEETVLQSWKGDNANLYIGKSRRLREDVRKEADYLKRVADTIRKMAQNTYNAEMRAYELAQNRSYNG